MKTSQKLLSIIIICELIPSASAYVSRSNPSNNSSRNNYSSNTTTKANQISPTRTSERETKRSKRNRSSNSTTLSNNRNTPNSNKLSSDTHRNNNPQNLIDLCTKIRELIQSLSKNYSNFDQFYEAYTTQCNATNNVLQGLSINLFNAFAGELGINFIYEMMLNNYHNDLDMATKVLDLTYNALLNMGLNITHNPGVYGANMNSMNYQSNIQNPQSNVSLQMSQSQNQPTNTNPYQNQNMQWQNGQNQNLQTNWNNQQQFNNNSNQMMEIETSIYNQNPNYSNGGLNNNSYTGQPTNTNPYQNQNMQWQNGQNQNQNGQQNQNNQNVNNGANSSSVWDNPGVYSTVNTAIGALGNVLMNWNTNQTALQRNNIDNQIKLQQIVLDNQSKQQAINNQLWTHAIDQIGDNIKTVSELTLSKRATQPGQNSQNTNNNLQQNFNYSPLVNNPNTSMMDIELQTNNQTTSYSTGLLNNNGSSGQYNR